MRKFFVPLCMFWLVAVVAGCGSDPRDEAINGTLQEMNKITSNFKNIRENLEKWEKEEKDSEKKTYLDNALQITEILKKQNLFILQQIKQQGEKMEVPTKEEKEDLKKRYQGRLATAVEGLAQEQKAINDALKKASAKGDIKELADRLRTVQGEFESLAKTR